MHPSRELSRIGPSVPACPRQAGACTLTLAAAFLAFFPTACRHNSNSRAPDLATSLAVQARATSVQLTWTRESAGHTGFEIERATGDGEFQRLAELAPEVGHYADTGLVPETTYHYRILALVAQGANWLSEVVTVTTTQPSVIGTSPTSGFTPGGQRVAIRGDGFSAGVNAVIFGSGRATELEILDDATLVCTIPAATAGPATVTVFTPTATNTLPDAFTYVPHPPAFEAPMEVYNSYKIQPSDVQMLSNGTSTHFIWHQNTPEPAVYATRNHNVRCWDRRLRLDSGTGRPWNPHAAISGDKLYVAWTSDFKLYMVRSTDNGETWSTPVEIAAPLGSATRPRIAADQDSVQVVWTDRRPGRGQLYHNYSSDGGQTFQDAAIEISEPFDAVDLRLAVRGREVYLLRTHLLLSGIYFNRSTDGGATWSIRDQRLPLNPGHTRASPPQLTVQDGRIFVLSQEGGDQRIALVRSLDRGATWSAAKRIDRDHHSSQNPHMSVTPNGQEVYVAWHETSNSTHPSSITINRSLDGGETFMRWPATAIELPSSNTVAPKIYGDGQIVTLVYAHHKGTSDARIHVNSSSQWGLFWQATSIQVSEHQSWLPQVHSSGAALVIGWQARDTTTGSYGLRAVRSIIGQ